MPSEPKKPIEELLETSAQARRQQFGSDPTMPNPMRTRLHDEIARRSNEREPAEKSSWFSLWWPRLSIATAVAVVLVGVSVIWSWQGPQRSHDIAMRESVESKTQPEEARAEDKIVASEPAAAVPSSRAFAEAGAPNAPPAAKLKGEIALAPAKQNEEWPASGAGETADAAQAPLLAQQQEGANQFKDEKQMPLAAASSALAKNQTNFRQQILPGQANQTYRNNAGLKQASQILNTFQVEQTGNQIRVVDADGSTYTGNIEADGRDKKTFKERQSLPAAPERAQAKRGQDDNSVSEEFYFRTTGYNSSLKKPVVFEGNYILNRSGQQDIAGRTRSSQAEQTQARIVGTAKIHGESPVKVDAVSTP